MFRMVFNYGSFSFLFFFFFSSRRRHTRSLRDWSSDVCSSDLRPRPLVQETGRAISSLIWAGLLLIVGVPAAGAWLAVKNPKLAAEMARGLLAMEIGRASCRERVEISVDGVSSEKENAIAR